jgi:hypothetical protein
MSVVVVINKMSCGMFYVLPSSIVICLQKIKMCHDNVIITL